MMKSIKYKARKGATFSNEEAQVIGETIANLRNKEKHVTPEVIVENAKLPISPIHNFFEWDNIKASNLYRLQQARDLVNHIVQVVVVEGEEVEQRSFFSVNVENKGKVYVTLKDAVSIPSYRIQLLNQAITIQENLLITLKLFRKFEK